MKTNIEMSRYITAIAEHKQAMRTSAKCKSGRCGDNHKAAIQFYSAMIRKNKKVAKYENS